jgi:peptidyl-prolyl cis-trans isomerase A (cyclophilin A)
MTKTLPFISALFFAMAVPDGAAAQANPQVLIKTTKGEIVVELYPAKAPVTVENFLKYVDDKHYDNTIFHRVIGNFMIQGGGFTADLKQKPTRAPIPIESRNGLKNERGAIAMARTSDPNSATSQFFINVVDNARLDYPSFDGHGYTAFGKVVAGMDVVERIRDTPTKADGPHQNLPVQPIVIRKAQVLAAASPTTSTTEKK